MSEGTTVVVVNGDKHLKRRLKLLTERQEQIIYNLGVLVANFDALNATVAGLGSALTAAVDRVADDVAALLARIEQLELDTEDQAQIDTLTSQLQASVDQLNAIDPVVSEEPEEPTPNPEG